MISQYHDIFYNFNKKKKKKTKSTYLKEKQRRRRKEETTSPAKDLLRSLYTIRKIVSFEALRAWRSGKSRHDPPQYSSRERWRVAFNFLDSFARLTSSTPRRCRCRVRSFPGRSNFTRTAFLRSFAYAFSGWIPLRYIISKIRVLRIDREKRERLEVSDYIVEKRRRVKAG